MTRKRLVLLLSLGALLVVGAMLILRRDWLFESWHLFRLERVALPLERTAIFSRLAAVGGFRSAVRLAEEARVPLLEEAAVEALVPVLGRVGVQERLSGIRALLDLLGEKDVHPRYLMAALQELGNSTPEALPIFLETFQRKEAWTAWRVASRAIFERWELDPSAVETALATASPEVLTWLFLSSDSDREGRNPGRSLRIAAKLSRDHPDSRARAAALSFRVFTRPREEREFQHDLSPLREAFEDRAPLVKTAAIRISGFLGDGPGGLELGSLFLAQEDPALLAEIIQALSAWTLGENSGGLELWDGFACRWIPRRQFQPKHWSSEEIARLRSILESRREPALRDAVSLALARRYRGHRLDERLERHLRGQHSLDASLPPLRVPGFRVHEWGVWVESKDRVVSAARPVDLPGFVHRNEVSPLRLSRERVPLSHRVLKPVVFFHAPEPLEVHFRIQFHHGMPWVWFPAATDLVEAVEPSEPSRVVSKTPSSQEAGGPEARPLASVLLDEAGGKEAEDGEEPEDHVVLREEIHPPWIDPLAGRRRPPRIIGASTSGRPQTGRDRPPFPFLDPADGISSDLRPFYPTAPWLVPFRTGGRGGVVTGVGLEWCGLRVGHPEDLEGPMPAAEPGSWWARLRAGGASEVAVRGEREKFLFYDGAMDLPAPVKAAWADGRRQDLLLAVRPFHELPELSPRSSMGERWWLRDEEMARLRITLPIPAVFIIQGHETRAVRWKVLESLSPEETALRVQLEGLSSGRAGLAGKLEEVLTREGLTRDEARGLIDIWQDEFLDAPGLRILTVFPRWLYEALLPAEVFPVPEDFVRVGLLLKECGNLPVGEESLGITKRSRESRPWILHREPVAIRGEPLPAGTRRTLERREDGELLHGPGRAEWPGISEDGTRVAFDVPDGESWSIAVADLEAGFLEELSLDQASSKTLSGDGRRIAFLRGEGEGRRACVADLRAGTLLELPSQGFPRITPDGSKVLVHEIPSDGLPALRLFDLEASAAFTILELDERNLGTFDLSRDGLKVAFALGRGSRSDVFLADLERLTIWNVSQDPANDDFPVLSADGRRLFFHSHRTRDQDIFLADLESRTLRNLTLRPGADRFPSPSADGKRLLYSESGTGIVGLDLETGKRIVLPGTAGVSWAILSGDGRRAAFLRSREGVSRACVVDVPW